ncbi:MBG domain-containing protein [Negadavirga shengliensis]|uniref:MBG domain-containing protein n=1 Tax=Negadavirga shengliensis TaxID=1389218 RepID=A0ABV9T232_9BACT
MKHFYPAALPKWLLLLPVLCASLSQTLGQTTFNETFDTPISPSPATSFTRTLGGEVFVFEFTNEGDGGDFAWENQFGEGDTPSINLGSSIFNTGTEERVTISRQDRADFIFTSIFINNTAGETVTVQGYKGGTVVGSSQTVATGASATLSLGNITVDEVRISSTDFFNTNIDSFTGNTDVPEPLQINSISSFTSDFDQIVVNATTDGSPSPGSNEHFVGFAVPYGDDFTVENGVAPAAQGFVVGSVNTGPGTLSVTFDGLAPGRYDLKLGSANWNGSNPETYNYNIQVNTNRYTLAPEASGSIQDIVTTPNQSFITLNWDSSDLEDWVSLRIFRGSHSTPPNGGGPIFGTSNVISSGSPQQTSFTSLSPATAYDFTFYALNQFDGQSHTNSYIEVGTVNNVYTLSTLPGGPAANLQLSSDPQSQSELSLEWDAPSNTSGYLVYVNQGTVPANISSVQNGQAPPAEAEEVSGPDIVLGGLNAGTQYTVTVIPFNRSGTNHATAHYRTSDAISVSFSTLPPDDEVDVSLDAAGTAISSVANSQGEATFVMGLTLEDEGTDGADLLLDKLTIRKSDTDDFDDWTQILAGAVLVDSDGRSDYTGVDIFADRIEFSGFDQATNRTGGIQNGASKGYELYIWLKETVDGGLDENMDGSHFGFEVTPGVDIETAPSSSGIRTTETISTSGTDNEVVVTATDLAVTTQPSADANAYFPFDQAATVQAVDANGNWSKRFTSTDFVVSNTANIAQRNTPDHNAISDGSLTASDLGFFSSGVTRIVFTDVPTGYTTQTDEITINPTIGLSSPGGGLNSGTLEGGSQNQALIGVGFSYFGSFSFTDITFQINEDPAGKIENIRLVSSGTATSYNEANHATNVVAENPVYDAGELRFTVADQDFTGGANVQFQYYFLIADVVAGVNEDNTDPLVISFNINGPGFTDDAYVVNGATLSEEFESGDNTYEFQSFPPAISSVAVPSDGTYESGSTLEFTVNYDENVTVNTTGGTPYLGIVIGSTTRQAGYTGGSGGSALMFSYTVQDEDLDLDGIELEGAIQLNGGTLRDAAGNDALLTLDNVGSTENIIIHTIRPNADNVLYVDQNVPGGSQMGDSWANAITELHTALSWAQSWDASTNGTLQIWVAAGKYLPTGDPTDRHATFRLVSGVEIYGGFDGTETGLEARDWEQNVTILSGDIDENDNDIDGIITDVTQIQGDNSYHVVTGSGAEDTAVLDGFTITGGKANGSTMNFDGGGIYNSSGSATFVNLIIRGNSSANFGGGMFSSSKNPTLINVVFSNNESNTGGGMANIFSSSPKLTNVTFSGNSANNNGGGMHNFSNSAPKLTKVTFSGNTANGSGGGMHNVSQSSPILSNVVFSSNEANNGGGMYNSDHSNPELTNVTFSGNSANNNGGGIGNDSETTSLLTNVSMHGNTANNNGGAIYSESNAEAFVRNSIIWGNSATNDPQVGGPASYAHSLVEGMDLTGDGPNNLDGTAISPQFVSEDPEHGEYLHLRVTSPAINAGDNVRYEQVGDLENDLDLADNPRLVGGTIDMGAYEVQHEPQTITAENITKTYGDEAFTHGSSDSGLPLTYSSANMAVAEIVEGQISIVGAGTATITASQAGDDNYLPAADVEFTLTVEKALLTITANDATGVYDGEPFTGGNGVSYSGFVNGEDESVLTGTLTYSGDAQGATDVGTYGIIPEGLSSENYAITFESGTLTISQSEVNELIFNAQTVGTTVQRIYGGGIINGAATASSGLIVNYESGDTTVATVDADGNVQITGVGVTTITATQAGDTNYAPADPISFNLEVLQATLTVTANHQFKIYDGLPYSGGNGVSYSGFVNGEDETVLTGILTYSGDAQGATDVGAYGIIPEGLSSENYAITFESGTLTISRSEVNELIFNAQTVGTTVQRIYGGGIINGAATASSGLIVSYASSDATVATVDVDGNVQITGVGTTTIKATQAGNVNYAPADPISFNLEVQPAPLTVTANDATKVYDAQPFSGGSGVSYSGFVNGDDETVLDGVLTYGGSSQGATETGSYAIVPDGLTADNYLIAYVPGTLTVVPSGGNVLIFNARTAGGTVNVTYGASPLDGSAQATSGLPVTYASSNTSVAAVATDGKVTVAGAGTATITASQRGDSNFNPATDIRFTVQVSRAPLTVTALNQSKIYDGEPYSGGNGVSYSGFVNGEDESVLDGALSYQGSAQGAVDVGSYMIEPGGFTSGNYNITYQPGSLTVAKAPLTIRAEDKTKVYGGDNPELTFVYEDLVPGDKGTAVQPGIATTATANSGIGIYPITLSGAADNNYDITYRPGSLTVTKAPLAVTAHEGQTKLYGDPDPVFAYHAEGFVAGDDEHILSGVLAREPGESAGEYAIGIGTLTAGNNYAIEFMGADFRIIGAAISMIMDPADLETPWGTMPELPAQIVAVDQGGGFFEVPVLWETAGMDIHARGSYRVTGRLQLEEGILNPDGLGSSFVLTVLPKPRPTDLYIDNPVFAPEATRFFFEIGELVVVDEWDDFHRIELLGDGADNRYFEVHDGRLYWSSADRAEGRTVFRVRLRVTDRDGNELDRVLELERERTGLQEIMIHNSFTPNGDGLNDSWGINELRFHSGVRISVFERSGKRVFYTEDPDVRWDGTFEGRDVPVGTYYYVVEVREQGQSRRGFLTVIRE